MDARQIVNELESIGVRLHVQGAKVKLRGPEKYVKDPAILERVRERKPEIVAFLSRENEPQLAKENIGFEPTLQAPTERCRACNGYVFWQSVHGPVICVVCHSPANPRLVKQWVWVCEGSKLVQ